RGLPRPRSRRTSAWPDRLLTMGALEAGPRPNGRFPRWVRREDVPVGPLPPVPRCFCPPKSEGDGWHWLQPFVDIRSGKPVNERSRFAVAWDAEHLYAIFEFVDAHREA